MRLVAKRVRSHLTSTTPDQMLSVERRIGGLTFDVLFTTGEGQSQVLSSFGACLSCSQTIATDKCKYLKKMLTSLRAVAVHARQLALGPEFYQVSKLHSSQIA
jgi:hypothetical protein